MGGDTMTDKIKAMLESAVNKAMPVREDALPDVFPCITFHIYNESGSVFGAGKVTEETAMCQIDIWYKTKTALVETAIKNIKQAIINTNSFSHPRKEYDYETDKKIHHTYFNFEFIVESEE